MADEKKPAAGHTFTHVVEVGDKAVTKKFRTTFSRVIIPHLNDGEPMTSLEISTDSEAQKHLVAVKSQAIEEVPGDIEA